MSNINDPIPYEWKLGWDEEGMCGKPTVNPLLKAILEKDVDEMKHLHDMGASLSAMHKETFKRVLYHVANSYPVMKWLVDHGFSRIGNDIDYSGNNGINDQKTISPTGHFWDVSARAYYTKAYDVLELLVAHGFDEFHCYEEEWGNSKYADHDILMKRDEKGIRILLENGYIFSYSTLMPRWIRDRYNEFILGRSQVRRKTVGLDAEKFKLTVTPPQYEDVPLIFGRKEAQARNARIKEDYEDRVRARKEFIKKFGEAKFLEYAKGKKASDDEFTKLMASIDPATISEWFK